MQQKPSTAHASDIDVSHGRITLIWPLILHMKEPPEQASTVDRTVMGIAADLAERHMRAPVHSRGRLWHPVNDPIQHIPRPVKTDSEPEQPYAERLKTWENEAYAEAVYFHEFVQDFLYRPPKDIHDAPFRMFRRLDVKFAKVRFAGGYEREVKVERTNLYLFRTGVAIMTMDMVIPQIDKGAALSGWTLAEFETFHDVVRRAYAPFFVLKDGERKNGHLVLDSVAWLDGNREVLHGLDGKSWAFDLDGDKDEVGRYLHIENNIHSRYPPLFRHWRVLLSPDLALADYDEHRRPSNPGKDDVAPARWHHVVDERMATLATVSVNDETNGLSRYNKISDGDMVRLCFADMSGEDDYPYDPTFLSDFDERYAYDRFRSSGTRFLVSGYSFVAVVAGYVGDNIIAMHMRRHYFQMALLVHMEMASLLSFSGQVSRAVQAYGSDGSRRRQFERAMSAIQEEFLQFMHRFRFTGLSNQVQAQELLSLWRKNLRTEELFADVSDEISVANDFLRAEASRRSTDAAEWLSLVGGVGVFVGLILGVLGINFVSDTDVWREILAIDYKPLLNKGLSADMIVVGGFLIPVSMLTGAWLWLGGRKIPEAISVPFVRMAWAAFGIGVAFIVAGLVRFH